jgi:hypothetical protein
MAIMATVSAAVVWLRRTAAGMMAERGEYTG